MTEAGVEQLVAADRENLQKVLGPDGADQIRADTAKHYERHARLGNRILQNFVQFLKVY